MNRSMSCRIAWAAVLYGLMAHGSSAQTFYQCLSRQGHPEFSEQPCELGTKPENDSPRAAPVESSSAEEPLLQAEKMNSPACKRALREVDVLARALHPGADEVQARRAAMYAACGMTPLPEVSIINRPGS